MNENKFHDLLKTAIENGASDIMIKEDGPAALRIAGEMIQTTLVTDAEFVHTAITEIVTDEGQAKRYHETGDLDTSFSNPEIGRFRVNVHRQRSHHALTLRYVKSKILTVEELNLPPILNQLALTPRGIILVCGTTGSGKSTTLAAMLQYINNNAAKHIITVEDPIEYEFKDNLSFFEQREVGIDTKDFTTALTAAMRQAPDVIMVGEMRSQASFEAALQASDTGHMVMSTVHAADATQAVTRILDLYPKDEQDSVREALALNLKATIAQRLAPRLDVPGSVVPAIEIMINTGTVQQLIQKNHLEKLAAAVETGKEDGMQSFNQCILALIQNGVISEEVGMKFAGNAEALKMNLQGIFLGGSDSRIIGG